MRSLSSIAEDRTYQGAKIAVLFGDRLLTYLRDDKATIPNPNEWDLPGGVRDGNETALDCALRETKEEFGIALDRNWVTYASDYTAHNPTRRVAFFAASAQHSMATDIRFGDEGQEWRFMALDEFVSHSAAVSELKTKCAELITHGATNL